ncbi:tetratricopeptide repeat-containing sensor histidine kinase [Lacihabitans lacunae]|uniref:histidine kinase n=1 Tax=Lacihabitans lacunae TaxID=1028214 RepID=A0ABV7YWI9_9BACT
MKKVIIYLFFLFFGSLVFGQANSKLDSLKRVLAKLPEEGKSFAKDTLRVNLFCDIGEEYRKKKIDSSFYFGKEALSLTQKRNFKKGKVKSYILIGNYYSSQSLSVKATENYLKALAIAEELKLINEQILLTAEIGSDYLSLNDFKQSYLYFKKHTEICKKYGSNEDYALSINNLGVLFFDQNKYSEALKYFLECEKWSKKTNNPKLINASLINVGKVYVELNKFDEALIRFNKALVIEDGYLDKSAFVNNEIAVIYLKKNDLKKALKSAKIAFFKSNSLNKSMIKDVSLTLSQIYDKLGNEKEALNYYKLYSEISLKEDSVKNNQLVRFMNLDYENEKQLFKIEGLNTSVKIKENQNKILFGSVLMALVIIILTLFLNNAIKKKKKFIECQKLEIEDLNQNLEIKIKKRTEELSEANKELIKKNFEITEALFKGQTIERKRVASELHDNLGSTLSALKWRLEALNSEALTSKEKEIYDSIKVMMGTAYQEVRNISHNLSPAAFEKLGLIGSLNKFINEINENKEIKFDFFYSGDSLNVSKKTSLDLYTITLELINNIIKHSKASEAKVNLIFRSVSEIYLVVEDNGVGFSKEANLKKEFQSFNRIEYPWKFTSEINNLNPGTQVKILVINQNNLNTTNL